MANLNSNTPVDLASTPAPALTLALHFKLIRDGRATPQNPLPGGWFLVDCPDCESYGFTPPEYEVECDSCNGLGQSFARRMVAR